MLVYRVEAGGEDVSKCICCNNKSLTGHGFVYRNEDAYAVYYGAWSSAHVEKLVSFAVAIGEWGDDSTSNDRVCFGVEAKENDDKIIFRVLSPDESPWPNANLLGKMLDREDALIHENIGEVFTVLEKIVQDHPAIRDYLNS